MSVSQTLRFGGFSLDGPRACLRSPKGEEIRLRPQSLAMLELFLANAGRVVSKQELFEAIWPNVHVGEDSLFQCIREIRAALGDERRQLLKLVSGRGYLFSPAVSAEPARASGQAEAPALPEARAEAAPAPIETPPQLPASAIDARRVPAAPGDTPQLPIALAPTPSVAPAAVGPRPQWAKVLRPRGWRARIAFGALAAALALVTLMLLRPGGASPPRPPVVAVMPIFAGDGDSQASQAANGLTKRLADGLSQIANIRVVAPGLGEAGGLTPADRAVRERANFVVTGDLQKNAGYWEARARMVGTATGELLWTLNLKLDAADVDAGLLQDRLTGAFGYAIAARLNKLVNAGGGPAASEAADSSEVVIEQAKAFIEHTTPERFRAADALLEKALARQPDNVDLQVALASHRLRGVQTDWYSEPERAEKQAGAEAMLVSALKAKPTYVPALEGYCRFLTATNRFVDSQVACAQTLAFDPWDGTALYEMGLGQLQLGRFEEALATFTLADRYDTPRVSRWTWALGAGLACLFLDRNEEAIAWLEKSIAITPGSGRSFFALAAAYKQAGRAERARLTLAKGLAFKPDATIQTFALPPTNASPAFLEARDRLFKVLVDLGLPES